MRFSYRKTMNVMPLILALVMLFQLVAPVFSGDVLAQGGKKLDYKVITDANLTYSEGTSLEEYVELNSIVKIDYKWEIHDDWVVEDGDYAIIPIPEAFNLGNANFEGNLACEDQNYGKWSVDVNARTLKLTFNNMPDEKSNVEGHVSIKLNLRLDEIKVELPYKLEIPISGDKTKDFIIKSKPSDGFSINKSGKISEDDINKQLWTLDINTSLDEVEDAIVTDNIDERLNYIDGSLKVYNLKVYSDGTTELGDEVKDIYNVEYNHPNIEVNFPDGINKAYRLVYSTEIDKEKVDTSKTKFEYKNNAEFNGESDSKTVVVERDPLIKKEGKASQGFNADKIDWEIYVNQSLYKLNGVKVEDTIPEGLELDGNIKVHSIDGGEKSIVPIWKYDIEQSENTFTVRFKDEIDKEYLIEYTTKVNAEELKNNKNEIKFENNAKITQKGKEDEVSTKKEITLKKGKVINKDAKADISYNDHKYIDWVLDINTAELELDTDTVSDTMGEGLKLDKNKGIKIYELNVDKDTGDISEIKELVLGTDYEINYKDEDKFDIKFKSNIKKPYRIKYRTIITDYETGTFKNVGTVDGINAEKGIRPDISSKFEKTSLGQVNYLEKEINWQIRVNPIQKGMDNFEIMDKFEEGEMTEEQFNNIEVLSANEPFSKFSKEKIIKDGKIKGIR